MIAPLDWKIIAGNTAAQEHATYEVPVTQGPCEARRLDPPVSLPGLDLLIGHDQVWLRELSRMSPMHTVTRWSLCSAPRASYPGSRR